MRRTILFTAIATLAFAAQAQATPAEDFTRLLHDYDEAQLKLYPSNAIQRADKRYLGLYDDDLTPDHLSRERATIAGERARLAAIGRAALSPAQQLSYDILKWTLAARADEIAPGEGEARQEMPLDQFNGAHLTFAREMEWRAQYPFTAAADYDQGISRMQGFAHWIDMAIARMREGMAKGTVLPRIIAERVLDQLTPIAAAAPETNLFMGPVKNIPASVREPARSRVAAAWTAAVRDGVLPAYRRLAAFLKDEYLPKARASVGLSALPGGRALYLDDVHSRTTLDLSPDAIHALGLRELQRIARDMEAVKNEAGFSGSLAAFIQFLRADPRFKFRDPAAMMADLTRALRTAQANAGRLFTRLPRTRLEIRFYEPFVAPTKSSAEYSPLSADGRRPGIVYANDYDLASRPAYTTDVMILHEGIPGHHLQIALAVENASLPALQRFSGPAAFLEGWATYAETLGAELGLYQTPYQKFGALAYDAWRSARLVVDTGIHWDGWSEKEAEDFLRVNTALSDTEITAEVERYIAIPAQALAYKLGALDIERLRDEARTALGPRFDLRRFHDELLKDGAMPLPILDARMARWIAAEKTR